MRSMLLFFSILYFSTGSSQAQMMSCQDVSPDGDLGAQLPSFGLADTVMVVEYFDYKFNQNIKRIFFGNPIPFCTLDGCIRVGIKAGILGNSGGVNPKHYYCQGVGLLNSH